MILRLDIENFRCFASHRTFECAVTSAQGSPVTWLNGVSGTGKTTVVEALRFLHNIARGMARIDQYCGGETFAISPNVTKPVDLSISFVLEDSQCLYGIRLEYAGVRKWQVENEWLTVNGGVVFARTGNHVEIGGTHGVASYELDRAVFVLSTFVTQDTRHPVARVRNYLAQLFVLAPVPALFSDVVKGDVRQIYLDAYGRNVATWATAFFGVNMSAYPRFTTLLERYVPGTYGFRSGPRTNNSSRLYLALHDTYGRTLGIPMSMVSNRQKTIIFGCLMMTVCQTLKNIFCVWDDFDMMADASMELATSLCSAFAVRGQLVFTSLHDYDFPNAKKLQL